MLGSGDDVGIDPETSHTVADDGVCLGADPAASNSSGANHADAADHAFPHNWRHLDPGPCSYADPSAPSPDRASGGGHGTDVGHRRDPHVDSDSDGGGVRAAGQGRAADVQPRDVDGVRAQMSDPGAVSALIAQLEVLRKERDGLAEKLFAMAKANSALADACMSQAGRVASDLVAEESARARADHLEARLRAATDTDRRAASSAHVAPGRAFRVAGLFALLAVVLCSCAGGAGRKILTSANAYTATNKAYEFRCVSTTGAAGCTPCWRALVAWRRSLDDASEAYSRGGKLPAQLAAIEAAENTARAVCSE